MDKFLKIFNKILDKTRNILLVFCCIFIFIPLVTIAIIVLFIGNLFSKNKTDFHDWDDEEY